MWKLELYKIFKNTSYQNKSTYPSIQTVEKYVKHYSQLNMDYKKIIIESWITHGIIF